MIQPEQIACLMGVAKVEESLKDWWRVIRFGFWKIVGILYEISSLPFGFLVFSCVHLC